MSDLPILYSFRRCPYAIRARMALAVSGTRCSIREIKLSEKPFAFIQASPKATVPVLILADGTVLEQSLDIARWALEQKDPEGWLGGEDLALIETNDGPFKRHLNRYKYPDKHDGDPAVSRAAGAAILAELDARLGSHANLHGERRSLTDIALFPFIRQFAAVDRLWFDAQPFVAVRAWLDRHAESPLFEAVMMTLPQWHPGDADTPFPA